MTLPGGPRPHYGHGGAEVMFTVFLIVWLMGGC